MASTRDTIPPSSALQIVAPTKPQKVEVSAARKLVLTVSAVKPSILISAITVPKIPSSGKMLVMDTKE